ncbi:MAG: hypothetical protein LBR55_03825, partial [Bacteroidales bacterium]|nr:hypothetical protein [Bacteroidales bacterium]
MTIKKIILILAFGVIATSSFAQVNFFGADDDAQTKDFYKRSMRYTVTALCNFPKYNVGAAFLLHSPYNRISFYFDAKINIQQYYTIDGTEIIDVETTNSISKSVRYKYVLANVGIARAVTRNFILYAAVGICAQKTDFSNSAGSNSYYSIPRQGVQHNFSVGVFYVTDKKFTFQLGMDLFDRSINT